VATKGGKGKIVAGRKAARKEEMNPKYSTTVERGNNFLERSTGGKGKSKTSRRKVEGEGRACLESAIRELFTGRGGVSKKKKKKNKLQAKKLSFRARLTESCGRGKPGPEPMPRRKESCGCAEWLGKKTRDRTNVQITGKKGVHPAERVEAKPRGRGGGAKGLATRGLTVLFGTLSRSKKRKRKAQ